MLSCRRHASLTRPIPNVRTKSPTKDKKKSLFYATSIDDFFKKQSTKPMISQDQKVRQIEDNLTTSLIGLTNNWDIFNAYKNAFDQVIHSFKPKSTPMIKVKIGYDQFINLMKSEYESEVEKIESIKKTSDQAIANLTIEREKIKTKRESLHQIIDQVNTINHDLIKENNEIQAKIRNLMILISEKNDIINEKSAQISNLQIDFSNYLKKKEKSFSTHLILTEKIEKLNILLRSLTVDVEKNLDSLYTHRSHFYEIQDTTKKLSSILNEMQKENIDKRNQINELNNRKIEICSQIQQISNETNDVISRKQKIDKTIQIIREKSCL